MKFGINKSCPIVKSSQLIKNSLKYNNFDIIPKNYRDKIIRSFQRLSFLMMTTGSKHETSVKTNYIIIYHYQAINKTGQNRIFKCS